MTPAEFIKEHFGITDNFDLAGNDHWLKCMKEYAKYMCDEQKSMCEAYAEIEHDSYDKNFIFVNSNSILNAPYPEDLQ